MAWTKHYYGRPRINSFDDVVAHYTETKPIISKLHTAEHDIRPIHERRYKHERIVKIDENTYGFSDGYYDPMGGTSNATYTEEFFHAHLPILWSRDANGDTFIRVRNGAGKYAHTSRYQFLTAFLPRGLGFFGDSQGQQFIGAATPDGEQKYLLPKSMYTWNWGAQKPNLDVDDKMYLTFKALPDNKFERVGELITVKTKHVDRATKKSLKPQLEALYSWVTIMAPMLPKGYSASKDAAEAINAHEGREVFTHVWSAASSEFSADTKRFVLDVLNDDEHAMRTNFAIILATKMYEVRWRSDELTVKKIRTRYNAMMHKMLQLFKSEQV